MPEIIAAPTAPFPIEVMVYEEDTWLLMSAGNSISEIRQSMPELESGMIEQTARESGDLLIKGNRWFAIVNNIDDEEFDKAEAVQQALDNLADEVADREITSFGIQVFSGFPEFEKALREVCPATVERIWIQTSD